MKALKQLYYYFTLQLWGFMKVFLVTTVLVDLLEIFMKWEMNKAKGGVIQAIAFDDNHLIIAGVTLSILGISLGSYLFNGYMEIGARRKVYLKGMISYSLCIGVVMLVGTLFLNKILEVIVKGSLPVLLEKTFEISWVETLRFFWLTISLGLLIGSLYYRLKLRSFLLVVGGIAYLCFYSGIKSESIVSYLQNPFLYGMIVVLMMGSMVLLYKAPVKKYAQTWL